MSCNFALREKSVSDSLCAFVRREPVVASGDEGVGVKRRASNGGNTRAKPARSFQVTWCHSFPFPFFPSPKSEKFLRPAFCISSPSNEKQKIPPQCCRPPCCGARRRPRARLAGRRAALSRQIHPGARGGRRRRHGWHACAAAPRRA